MLGFCLFTGFPRTKQGGYMNDKEMTHKEVAQYLDIDLPLLQIEQLSEFNLEPLPEFSLEPLPEINIAKEIEQMDKLEADLLSDLEGLDDE